ncbi:MAG: hypothetical protein FWD15_03815 [Alphaproteobacteria bacterium]|nr:hypothetical protein [Alphaproteobacteria bacterium]
MKKVIIGIQGGAGSFNEQAANKYIQTNKIANAEIKYLYTSDKVLSELEAGKIEIGVLAVYNRRGKFVDETLAALMKHSKSDVIDMVAIKISHHLMKRRDAEFANIKQIVAHPQVFDQCKENLKRKYPDIGTKVLSGDLVDTARAAKALAEGELPPTTAILGPEGLATIYGFDIVENNLQDSDNNITTFLITSA